MKCPGRESLTRKDRESVLRIKVALPALTPRNPNSADVATMSDVRACARAIVQRVADGGEIPIASLRELADLVLRSELVAVSQQLLDGPPEFALRRAMELAGLILAVVASDGRDAEQRAAK